MKFEFADTSEGLSRFRAEIEAAPSIALDLEAAGFHRYSDRVCLVQVTLPSGSGDRRNWVLDPLALDLVPVLGPVIEDPEIPVLMHGADFDVRLLRRDFDLRLRGLVDTQIIATLLGEPGIGLAALLEKYHGVSLAKKYQRADWARRPLDRGMLEYAASDTAHLHSLTRKLVLKLEQQGRGAWASEEFRLLESIEVPVDDDVDPVSRFKKARGLAPRELERLRAAWRWRDEIARRADRAPFRIASDDVLIGAALDPPRSVEDFAARKGVNGRLAREHGAVLVERLTAVEHIDEEDIEGYPRPPAGGRGRPTPDVEARASRLKKVRNRYAESLGVDRGALLPNAVLMEIAFEKPNQLADLDRIDGIKQWQIEAVGTELLTALN